MGSLIPYAPSTATAAPASILVVEDDEDIRQALTDVLVEEGYKVRSCRDAVEALAHLKTRQAPDLILLDLMMPRMDGWEFRVEQRRQPGLAGIPVIALSGDSSAKARAIDADAYLRKPVDYRNLLDTVERLLISLERKRLEARSAELERLTSLGLLAAGIAHEVNNPLAFVSGNLELARRKSEELEVSQFPEVREAAQALRKLLDHASRGAERIAAVVRGVSTFSRPDDQRIIPLDVREVLESSIQLVSNEIRHRAELVRNYEEPPRVKGNPAKLGQVFLNLLINAAHAIGEGPTATDHIVRVSTRRSPEGKAVVEVSDTGRGIGADLVGRIFDPFFTTKPVGGGMGLGLTISQRLVTAMGGSISVTSEPGRGSTFRVELPAYHEESDALKLLGNAALSADPSSSARSAAGASVDNRPRILVVDDEPMMCDLLKIMLGDEYDVEALSSPRAALDRLLAGESFDLVLSDLMMPELTGMDLYAEIARARPEQAARMVFMTGGTFTERARAFLDRVGDAQLPKPFRHDEVLRLIKQRLARNNAAASAPS